MTWQPNIPRGSKQLQDLFLKEARKYHVLPLDDRFAERTAADRPSLTRGRQSFIYYPGAVRLPSGSSPNTLNRSYTITAWLDNPDGQAEGVLVTHGGKFGGYGLFVQNGKPTFVYNWGGSARYTVTAAEPLPPGKSTIRFDFAYDGGKPGDGGTAAIFVNDQKVGEGRIDRTVMTGYSFDESLRRGRGHRHPGRRLPAALPLHRQTGEADHRPEVMPARLANPLGASQPPGYRAKAESIAAEPADIIFDNTNFLPVYHNDMMNAAREAVIVSPFVTRRRAWQMLPNLEAALAKRVSVVVVTRPTNAYKDKDRPALEETLASLQGTGVRLLFKANIHQKFAVIDQKIVWYGSINLLSYGSAQESIMRLESPNIAQELLKDLGKSISA